MSQGALASQRMVPARAGDAGSICPKSCSYGGSSRLQATGNLVLGGRVCWPRSTWGLMDGLTDGSLRSPTHSEGISGLVDGAEAM